MPSGESRILIYPLAKNGVPVVDSSLATARITASSAVSELPRQAFDLNAGDPVLTTEVITQSTGPRSSH